MQIQFDTDNAAFDGDPTAEITEVLLRIAESVKQGYVGGKVWDSNGNSIGRWTVEGD
jgi:hypothetical protein